MKVRQDFDALAPADRKAFTDAINCLRNQPSQLDPNVYPAAVNRYMDYAVVHVNRTSQVHLDAFFLTWHRYFIHLFEKDLQQTCGYKGNMPYWNWPATADNLRGSPIFDGSAYSMSGDGLFTNNDPIQLAPFFSIPHGSGGGCVTTGPFAGMQRVMNTISIDNLIQGQPLPANAFALNQSCLTRDLNTYSAQTWCNYTAVQVAVEEPDFGVFGALVNGVIGSTSLGIHSGAHFIMGDPASNIYVSVMDPIWWPLHAMLDRVYTSWQARHPDVANAVSGTMTANNAPPSANGTVNSVHPDWGYFEQRPITIGELQSTSAGPFCYRYDIDI